MSEAASSGEERICCGGGDRRAVLGTDLSIGFDFEHGLRSTLVAARLAERLGVDRETATQTYYACLLQHVGCTADIHVRAQILGDTAAAGEEPPDAGVVWGASRDDGGDGALGGPRSRAASARRRDRPQGSQGGARDAARRRRLPRGGADADRQARAAGLDRGTVRSRRRALGREGCARSQGRGDPARDANRPRGPGHRRPARAGGGGACGVRSSASEPAAPSIRRSPPASWTRPKRSSPSTARCRCGTRRSRVSRTPG